MLRRLDGEPAEVTGCGRWLEGKPWDGGTGGRVVGGDGLVPHVDDREGERPVGETELVHREREGVPARADGRVIGPADVCGTEVAPGGAVVAAPAGGGQIGGIGAPGDRHPA